MAIKLIILATGDNNTHELLCEQSLITFGRSKSCTVTLEQAGVSRRHFIIRFTENHYVIVDENSTAGTILDGVQLDPKNCYQLGSHHEITLPGFIISVLNDGKAPRQERTTVMARKLMGKILDDANDADNLPRLTHLEKNLVFYFYNDKASFVLGTLAHLDFVIEHEHAIAKEHVTFIRDISGVRLLPIMSAQTFINDREITEAEILNHNDKIKLSNVLFVYQEYQDDEAIKALQLLAVKAIKPTKAEETNSEPSTNILKERHFSLLDYLDRIAWSLLFITAAGASFIAYRLIFSLQ